MYVYMYVCVKIEFRKQRMMQKVLQIQEIFDSLIKSIPVIAVFENFSTWSQDIQ